MGKTKGGNIEVHISISIPVMLKIKIKNTTYSFVEWHTEVHIDIMHQWIGILVLQNIDKWCFRLFQYYSKTLGKKDDEKNFGQKGGWKRVRFWIFKKHFFFKFYYMKNSVSLWNNQTNATKKFEWKLIQARMRLEVEVLHCYCNILPQYSVTFWHAKWWLHDQ